MRVETFAAVALAAGVVAFGVLMPIQGPPAVAQNSIAVDVHELAKQGDRFHNWQTVCWSQRGDVSASENILKSDESCYLRYIDVLDSTNPDSGFVAAFVVTDPAGVRVEFDVESRQATGLDVSLTRDGHAVWSLSSYGCLENGTCVFSGPAAEALVKAFSDNNGDSLEMHVDFVDPGGKSQNHVWPMWSFAPAFEDFASIQRSVGL